MSNQQDQLIPTQPSSIDENHPNSKIDQNDNQEPQLIFHLIYRIIFLSNQLTI